MAYLRYADDWILLSTGSKAVPRLMKHILGKWLLEHLGLELSSEKTVITNLRKARFLGFELFQQKNKIIKKINKQTNNYGSFSPPQSIQRFGKLNVRPDIPLVAQTTFEQRKTEI